MNRQKRISGVSNKKPYVLHGVQNKRSDPLEDERLAAQRERKKRIFLWCFSIAMVVTAGTAFTFKLIEFIHTATSEGSDALASFLIPVLNYLLVAAGFMFLFFWALVTGQFKNVESAKFRMLELQDEIDRQELEARNG